LRVEQGRDQLVILAAKQNAIGKPFQKAQLAEPHIP
jgi:hypothetical protein